MKTGCAAPVFVPNAIDATSVDSRIKKPADAARDPDGPTQPKTGVRDAKMAEIISRIDESSPPGVFISRIAAAQMGGSGLSHSWRLSMTYSAVMGWTIPS